MIPAVTRLKASDVCVVVTTYAHRDELCRRVVERVLGEGAGRVIIVANGAPLAARRRLAQLEGETPSVDLLALGKNRGSAGGVAAGISRFLTLPAFRAVWILDDDNVPRRGALAELLAWHGRLPGPGGLLAFRPSRPYQAAIVAGDSVPSVYPSRSACLSFNVVDVPYRLRRSPHRSGTYHRPMPIRIPYGAYGGLLLDRDAIDRIGLPRQDLVLYEDDAEYTARLERAALGLHLVPSALVDDVDGIWADDGDGRTAIGRMLTTPHAMRVFYSTRNRVYFESRYWCTNTSLFRVNKAVVVALLTLSALRTRRTDRLRMILAAMNAGERGDLGEDPAHPLPT